MPERPTVTEARQWAPESLSELAQAWDRTAGLVQIHLDEVARTAVGTGEFWVGTAAQEARAKAEEITAPARRAARALIAAAAAARDGAQLIGQARAEVVRVADGAAADGYLVGDDGTVTAPGAAPELLVLLGGETGSKVMITRRATELTALLVDALVRLGAVDRDTAARIDLAFAGQESAATVPAGAGALTPREVVGAWTSMSQDRIAEQVASMSPEQRRQLVDAVALEVGNTDGVPWELRMEANRVNIADAILAQRRVVDLPEEDKVARMFSAGLGLDTGSAERVWLAAHTDPVVRAAIVATHDREANARLDFYESLLAGDRQIIGFDPQRSSFIELLGDLDTASSVGVLIPGLNTTIEGSASDTETARRFVTAGHGDIAMLTYLGGPFPTGQLAAGVVDAGKPTYALEMAPRLAAFSEDVARTVGPGVAVTYIGHSYGGSILGTAEQLGLTADRTMYVAAAGSGVGVDDPSDWHNRNPDIQRFSMTAPGDWIEIVQGLPLSPHGADPDTMAGVVRLDTGNRLDGSPMAGPTAHSDVINEPSDAWHNILAVITGDWKELEVAGVNLP
ncbi:alpha/beta hydrolase [Mycobacterium sp. MS1601]|uniref:alpha/beta hydrolase n=1 Tax=Mycobacterium sp. MS1601 TaxID=1936029 RepID=UPI0009794194|nr:alpha/beta hydrolase [Mycobacterium sp. MS1601]AQA04962.1 alpha/beta hydrolase [Mycobacterium sp. MS1601]